MSPIANQHASASPLGNDGHMAPRLVSPRGVDEDVSVSRGYLVQIIGEGGGWDMTPSTAAPGSAMLESRGRAHSTDLRIANANMSPLLLPAIARPLVRSVRQSERNS